MRPPGGDYLLVSSLAELDQLGHNFGPVLGLEACEGNGDRNGR